MCDADSRDAKTVQYLKEILALRPDFWLQYSLAICILLLSCLWLIPRFKQHCKHHR